MKTQHIIQTGIACVLIMLNGLTSAQELQSFSKEIRVKKTIRGTDTIVEYDTIIKKDHFNEEEFKSFWEQMGKDFESAIAPFSDLERFEDEWRRLMMHFDSLNDEIDFEFDFDMDIRPPAYMFYFNN
ncbi:MAG: hypothetical protein ACP5DZ_05885 [Bacteroidales bacterium]